MHARHIEKIKFSQKIKTPAASVTTNPAPSLRAIPIHNQLTPIVSHVWDLHGVGPPKWELRRLGS
jgi:hypothetical protein